MQILILLLTLLQSYCPSPTLTMMTFNIRYDNPRDGENGWSHRKELVVESIEQQKPSIIAIQEALPSQLKFVLEHLDHFKAIGEPRDGANSEFCGLLIDTSKLEVMESGQLWLSEKPKEKGSVGWDAALTRTATWAKLKFVDSESQPFVVFGTHFDHKGIEARLESAKLIIQKATEIGSNRGVSVAILGDFNCELSSNPIKVFIDAHFRPAVTTNVGGTYHSFTGKTDGRRIDFILLNEGWATKAASILRPRKEGMSASDHDPVVVMCNPHNITKNKKP